MGLTRPPNGLLMFIGVLAGYYVASGSLPKPPTALLAFATAYSLNGASMAINDIVDIEVDRVNTPDRPLPSGLVTTQGAAALSAALSVIGLSAAMLVSLPALGVAGAFLLLALLYNVWLKPYGLPGNAAVSLTVVAPFLYGSVIATGWIGTPAAILGVLAFLANMGREVVKGIVDMEGDALRGVRTVARSYGRRSAALLGSLFYLSAVALSPLPALLGILGPRYLIIVTPADMGFIYSSIRLLRDPSPATSLRVKKEVLLWMLIALVAFLAGA